MSRFSFGFDGEIEFDQTDSGYPFQVIYEHGDGLSRLILAPPPGKGGIKLGDVIDKLADIVKVDALKRDWKP